MSRLYATARSLSAMSRLTRFSRILSDQPLDCRTLLLYRVLHLYTGRYGLLTHLAGKCEHSNTDVERIWRCKRLQIGLQLLFPLKDVKKRCANPFFSNEVTVKFTPSLYPSACACQRNMYATHFTDLYVGATPRGCTKITDENNFIGALGKHCAEG